MKSNPKAARKGGAKTSAERQKEKRIRDALVGLKQINVKAHIDDHQIIMDFVKQLNAKRGL